MSRYRLIKTISIDDVLADYCATVMATLESPRENQNTNWLAGGVLQIFERRVAQSLSVAVREHAWLELTLGASSTTGVVSVRVTIARRITRSNSHAQGYQYHGTRTT